MSDVQTVAGPEPPASDEPTGAVRRWAGRTDGALVAAVTVALALRFWGLGAQSFWYDEWLTTEAVSGSLPDLARHVANREGITPPYFVLMWVWARLVGDGELALRSFSALAGAATVPVAYAIATTLGQRRRVALAAAFLVATHPLLVWYSQEARPYSLLALLGALSVLTAVQADRTGRRRDVVSWGLVSAAAMAVHYFAIFLVIGEAAALLARRRIPPRVLALATVPVALVLAALAPVAVKQHGHAANRDWISTFPLGSRLEDAGQIALVGPSPRFGWLWAGVLVVIVAVGTVTLWRSDGHHRRVALALGLLGTLGVVLALAATVAGTDVFLGRYLLASFVPFLVAAAVALLGGRWARLGAAAVVIVALTWTATDVAVTRDPRLQRADWRGVAHAVADDAPGVLVVDTTGGLSSPLAHYLPGATTLDAEGTVTTDRIDVLVARPAEAPCNFYVGRACAFVFLGRPLTGPVAEQFRLDDRGGREVLDQFVVEHYRSDRPVELDLHDLVPAGSGGSVWVVPGTP